MSKAEILQELPKLDLQMNSLMSCVAQFVNWKNIPSGARFIIAVFGA